MSQSINLTEQAKKIIKNAIIFGEFKLGEALSEFSICKKYNLNKTPVREALIILNIEGLVRKVRRRGSFVFDITLGDIEQIAEVRYLLEEFAVKKSILYNYSDFLNDLNFVYKEMEIASNLKEYIKYLELDTKFHKTFFKYCRNKYLILNYEKFSSKVEALRFYVVQSSVDTGEGLNSHKAILESIGNQNTEELSLRLEEHLTGWLNKYKSDFKIGL
jgi:DNA-binding GntR family transcriptional regulator